MARNAVIPGLESRNPGTKMCVLSLELTEHLGSQPLSVASRSPTCFPETGDVIVMTGLFSLERVWGWGFSSDPILPCFPHILLSLIFPIKLLRLAVNRAFKTQNV